MSTDLPPMSPQDKRDYRHAKEMVEQGDETFLPVIGYFENQHGNRNTPTSKLKVTHLLEQTLDQGLSYRKLADKIDLPGVTHDTIYLLMNKKYDRVRDEIIEAISRVLRGKEVDAEDVARDPKVTDSDAEDMRRIYKENEGVSYRQIGEMFGISESYAYKIITAQGGIRI